MLCPVCEMSLGAVPACFSLPFRQSGHTPVMNHLPLCSATTLYLRAATHPPTYFICNCCQHARSFYLHVFVNEVAVCFYCANLDAQELVNRQRKCRLRCHREKPRSEFFDLLGIEDEDCRLCMKFLRRINSTASSFSRRSSFPDLTSSSDSPFQY